MIVWLLLQLAALLLAVFRVPLAAQYPQPAEFQAVRVMLAAQFAALAILFPWMLRTWGSALAVAAAGWGMLLAAALLAGWAISTVVPLGAFLTIWIAIFTTLAQIRSGRWQSIAVAVASAYILGGPLLWYLRFEFGPNSTQSTLWFGPLLAAVTTMPHLPTQAWAIACGVECFALLLWKIHLRGGDVVISKSSLAPNRAD